MSDPSPCCSPVNESCLMSSPYHVPRQRLSPQTYRRRRIAVAVALAAVVFGGFRLVSAVFGDTSTTKAATPTPSTNLIESDGSSPITAISTTSTSAPPKEPVVPTAATPATLLIAGDSDAGTFGPYLETLMNQLVAAGLLRLAHSLHAIAADDQPGHRRGHLRRQ